MTGVFAPWNFCAFYTWSLNFVYCNLLYFISGPLSVLILARTSSSYDLVQILDMGGNKLVSHWDKTPLLARSDIQQILSIMYNKNMAKRWWFERGIIVFFTVERHWSPPPIYMPLHLLNEENKDASGIIGESYMAPSLHISACPSSCETHVPLPIWVRLESDLHGD